MAASGVVNIRGREYLTVARRVSDFRASFAIAQGWAIRTEIVHRDAEEVVIRASIVDPEGREIASGYAEEKRASSQINRTSALENCETSAIGRALAAAGFGGTEYASANEVQQAIHQQRAPRRPDLPGYLRGKLNCTRAQADSVVRWAIQNDRGVAMYSDLDAALAHEPVNVIQALEDRLLGGMSPKQIIDAAAYRDAAEENET